MIALFDWVAANLLRIVVAAGLSLATLGGVYIKGHHDGRTACEARVAAAVAKQRALDAVTAATLQQELDRLAGVNADAQQQLADYEDRLKQQSRPGCTLTPDDAHEIDR